MKRHTIDPNKNTKNQIEEILKIAQKTDEVEITDEIDFQSALAEVEEGEYTNIENALHDNFLGWGVPYGAYFEFEEVIGPTILVIKYITSVESFSVQ